MTDDSDGSDDPCDRRADAYARRKFEAHKLAWERSRITSDWRLTAPGVVAFVRPDGEVHVLVDDVTVFRRKVPVQRARLAASLLVLVLLEERAGLSARALAVGHQAPAAPVGATGAQGAVGPQGAGWIGHGQQGSQGTFGYSFGNGSGFLDLAPAGLGDGRVAIGFEAQAWGRRATAVGTRALAIGPGATAVGANAVVVDAVEFED